MARADEGAGARPERGILHDLTPRAPIPLPRCAYSRAVARALAVKLLRLAIPHAVGAATAAGSACVLTAIAYVLLLVVAMVTGAGPGGPLALPFALISALLGAAASSLLVLLPAVCVARLASRWRARRWLWQPLVASAVVAAASALVALAWETTFSQPSDAPVVWLVLCALQLPLLGAYWSAVSVTEWLLALWFDADTDDELPDMRFRGAR